MPGRLTHTNMQRSRATDTNLRRSRPKHRVGACLVRVTDMPETTHLLGRVFDVFEAGCRLALPTRVRPGASLEVARVRRGGPAVLQARVVDCTREGGEWLHECAFARPLSEAECRAWLPD